MTVTVVCYDSATGKATPRWTPAQIGKAVVCGIDLSCPFYREKGTPSFPLAQCKLTEGIRPCSGYVVRGGFPCEEGKQELIRLDTPPKESPLNELVFGGFAKHALRNENTGVRLRNGTLRRRR